MEKKHLNVVVAFLGGLLLLALQRWLSPVWVMAIIVPLAFGYHFATEQVERWWSYPLTFVVGVVILSFVV